MPLVTAADLNQKQFGAWNSNHLSIYEPKLDDVVKGRGKDPEPTEAVASRGIAVDTPNIWRAWARGAEGGWCRSGGLRRLNASGAARPRAPVPLWVSLARDHPCAFADFSASRRFLYRENLFFATDVGGAIATAGIVFISANTPTKVAGTGAGRAANVKNCELCARTIAKVSTSSKNRHRQNSVLMRGIC